MRLAQEICLGSVKTNSESLKITGPQLHENMLQNPPLSPFSKGGLRGIMKLAVTQ